MHPKQIHTGGVDYLPPSEKALEILEKIFNTLKINFDVDQELSVDSTQYHDLFWIRGFMVSLVLTRRLQESQIETIVINFRDQEMDHGHSVHLSVKPRGMTFPKVFLDKRGISVERLDNLIGSINTILGFINVRYPKLIFSR